MVIINMNFNAFSYLFIFHVILQYLLNDAKRLEEFKYTVKPSKDEMIELGIVFYYFLYLKGKNKQIREPLKSESTYLTFAKKKVGL